MHHNRHTARPGAEIHPGPDDHNYAEEQLTYDQAAAQLSDNYFCGDSGNTVWGQAAVCDLAGRLLESGLLPEPGKQAPAPYRLRRATRRVPLSHTPGHREGYPHRYSAFYPSAAGAGTADGGLLRLFRNSGLQAGPPMGFPVGKCFLPNCRPRVLT